MSAPSCRVCGGPIAPAGQGRPPRYCSAACRQRAYRARKQTPEIPVERPRRTRQRAAAPDMPEKDVPHLERHELLAWRGMLEVQATILSELERELHEQTGLTLSEFDVLYQLWRTPNKQSRMVDLARAVLVTAGGVTRIVARLEERGLVRRLTVAGRQAVTTQLTLDGERELDAAMDVHFDGVRRMFLQYLDATDIDHLVTLWSRVKRGIATAGDNAQESIGTAAAQD